MARWYCKIGGKQYGPYATDDLKRLVAEGRLLPDDQLREDQDGAWFRAEQMRELFRGARRAAADDEDADDEDGFPRRRKRRKPSNYYEVFNHNLWASDAQWKKILMILMLLMFFVPLIVTIVAVLFAETRGQINTSRLITGLFWVPVMPVTLAFVFFLDALLFGLPCKAFRIRLDVNYHGVLDLFAICYLVGMLPFLLRYFVGLGSPRVGLIMSMFDPLVQAALIAVFIRVNWGLPVGRALLLASLRFTYQTLFMILYVVLIFTFLVD